MKVCSITGCNRRAKSRGLCDRCYQRWQKHGDATINANPMGRLPIERFILHVDFNGPVVVPELGPCWLWTGASASGYGTFVLDGRSTRAHRFLLEMSGSTGNGAEEPDHLCRTKACVRPSHLEWVSHRVNMQRVPWLELRPRCGRGHLFTEDCPRDATGRRLCAVCKEERESRQAVERAERGLVRGPDGKVVRTHCKRGHPLTPDNVYIRERGWRQCRTCTLASVRASDAAKAAKRRSAREKES